jgi:hypothetical protein
MKRAYRCVPPEIGLSHLSVKGVRRKYNGQTSTLTGRQFLVLNPSSQSRAADPPDVSTPQSTLPGLILSIHQLGDPANTFPSMLTNDSSRTRLVRAFLAQKEWIKLRPIPSHGEEVSETAIPV